MTDTATPGGEAPGSAATGGAASGSAFARLRPRRQQWWWWALMAVVVLVVVVTSAGSAPTEGVSDDRLFAIAARIKCVQCVGESVAGSSSPAAVQFREEISSQMQQGRTDDEILSFFADRYDDVLLTPPSSGVGSLVWVIPVVAIAAALLMLAATFRRWRSERSERSATDEDTLLVDAALQGREDPAGNGSER